VASRGRSSAAAALAAACAAAGLDSADAEVLYDRANTVYKLGRLHVVARLRYAPVPATWMDRLSVSVQVTAWLHELDFPTVQPLDVEQPVASHGYLVTFWHYLPATGPPWEDVESLGRLLLRLHRLERPPVQLPPVRPLSSLPEDAGRCEWLTDEQRSWLLSRSRELQQQYDSVTWALGCGLVHGDAYAENLIHTPERVVLSDWDSVSYGPREQDIVPASMRYRFGRPAAEWEEFCAAYGVHPTDLPGLTVLRQMREIRSLGPYVRSNHPQARAEGRRRLRDLISGTQEEPWRALNLA
jgi:hypothetical protein